MGWLGIFIALIVFLTNSSDGQQFARDWLTSLGWQIQAEEEVRPQNADDSVATPSEDSNTDSQESEPDGARSPGNPSGAAETPPQKPISPDSGAADAARALAEQMRADCEAHNASVDAEVAGIFSEIQRLEASLPALEAEALRAQAAYDADWNWTDFTQHMRLQEAKWNAESTLQSARSNLDSAYQDLNFASLKYHSCQW